MEIWEGMGLKKQFVLKIIKNALQEGAEREE